MHACSIMENKNKGKWQNFSRNRNKFDKKKKFGEKKKKLDEIEKEIQEMQRRYTEVNIGQLLCLHFSVDHVFHQTVVSFIPFLLFLATSLYLCPQIVEFPYIWF